jgi:putative glycosyltransferase (TIGR04372 family)
VKIRKFVSVLRELGLIKIALMPLATCLIYFLFFVDKFKTVRIHQVINTRFGLFVVNTELSRLSIIDTESRCGKSINLFCFQHHTSVNHFLEILWRREIRCLTGSWAWIVFDMASRYTPNLVEPSTSSDSKSLLGKFPALIKLDPSEIRIGQEFLHSIKIANGDKFVCLNVRDSAFLKNSQPLGWSKTRDWSYHNYRDSDIANFVPAAETLAEMGYTVFRMGAIVAKPLKSAHPKVIDYATNGMRSEFLDVFLGAHCEFCVSTGTGWDEVPLLFRRPTMYVNIIPSFYHQILDRELLLYPKILLDKLSGSELNLEEVFEKNLHNSAFTSDYGNASTVLRDMSSEELVEAVTEMATRVEGTFVETPEQKQMQAKLKRILSNHPKLQPTPDYYPIRAEFASCFLTQNPNFLD